MIRLDLSYFYRMGADFTAVRGVAGDQKMIDVWLMLDQLRNRVRGILFDATLGKSLRGAVTTGTALAELVDNLLTRDLEDLYTAYDRNALINMVNAFEILVTGELAVADAYFVIEKKPYSTSTLVSEGESLFPLDLPRKVPEAVLDLREAGKCLAFELHTAAAFHLHRAIEAVLRRYWSSVTPGASNPKQRNLGVYLRALKELGCGDSKVISALEQIKDLHRNVVIHPEVSLTSDEAKSLTGIASSVTSAMLASLPFVASELPIPDDQVFPNTTNMTTSV